MVKVEQESGENMFHEWDNIHQKVNTQIKTVIDDLANEFRSILGVS
jgi:hypothetical protein